MEKKALNIAVALDQNFFIYTYVMMTSVLENNRDSAVHFHVLHSELTEEQISAFDKLASSYGGAAHSVFIDPAVFSDRLPTTAQWPLVIYYRLLLPELLPDLERLLYLDTDMIIAGSLREFYDTDFEDKLLIVCSDIANNARDNHMIAMWKRMFGDDFGKDMSYFNSGMMLWNLAEVRKKYRFEDYLAIAEQFDYQLAAPDQDILNYCYRGKVKFADPERYNLFARLAHNRNRTYGDVKEHAKIVHFAGQKPWDSNTIHHDIEQLWWDYAKLTPYYGILVEDFTRKTINDPFTEDYIMQIYQEIETLKQNLDESLKLNERLLAMINQPK